MLREPLLRLGLLWILLRLAKASLALHYGEELRGHKAIRVECADTGQLDELEMLGVDLWWRDAKSREAVAHVDQHQLEILGQLPEYKFSIVHDDLAEYTRHSLGSRLLNDSSSADWFSNYHTYDEIYRWFEELSRDSNGTISFVRSIGVTRQKRDMFAVHVNLTPPRRDKKQIWIQSLIHAREWISGAVVQYIAMKLSQIKASIGRSMLFDVEYILIPIVNPDGYDYTWTHNRLWRKNMASSLFGRGVDLNRNFDDHWGTCGASNIPISDTYRGPRPASEPETVAIQNYFRSQPNIVGAIDWHSYSQLVLFPYGWTRARIKTFEAYRELTNLMCRAFALNGREYLAEQSAELYPTSGSATDWFKGPGSQSQTYDLFSLAIELPPSAAEGSGFLLGPQHIKSVGEEAWEAFQVFVNYTCSNAPLR